MASYYSVQTIAELLGITPRRVQQLAVKGVLPKPERGKYELVPTVQGYVKHLRELSQGQGSSLTEERVRLTKYNADKKELELQKARGELIQVSLAMELWGGIIQNMRSKLLGMPTKLAPLCFGSKSIPDIKSKIEKTVHEVMRDIANPKFREIARMAGDKRDTPNAKAAAGADGVRVVRRKKGIKPRK